MIAAIFVAALIVIGSCHKNQSLKGSNKPKISSSSSQAATAKKTKIINQ
jgi:hypothetical protein